LLIFRHS